MKIRKITLLAVMLAIGIIIQIFESTLPVIPTIPGGKIGLANIVSILCISIFDIRASLVLSILRPVLSSLLYGGITQLIYSLSGSLLSFAIMAVLIKKSDKFSYIGVGISGAMAHNIAQTTVAVLMYSNKYIYSYLPPLLILSIMSGYFTGFCSTIIIQKYNNRRKVSI